MDCKRIFYKESLFGGFSDIDGTIAFYMRVNGLLNPNMTVLDFGCGRGSINEDPIEIRKNLRIFKGRVNKVIGLDVDEAGKFNPFLDEFHLLDNNIYPLSDSSVDLCVCDWVVEHLEHPTIFFAEMKRIIKPGGYLCIRTPNRLGYFSIASQLIPNSLHTKVLSVVQKDRKEEDVFPTYYACNTITSVKKQILGISKEFVVYGYEGEPSYLSFSPVAYFLGVLYQRVVPAFFRSSIFVFAKIDK